MTTESKRLKEEAKKFNTTVQTYTMATLMAVGWTDAEAYALAYHQNATLSATNNARNRENITSNPNFKDLVKKVREKIVSTSNVMVKTSASGNKQLSKDEVAEILLKQIYALPDGKEKAEVTMKYADLFQYKREEVKQEEDLIRTFLPLTCSICPYKQYFDENIKKKEENKTTE